MIAAVTSAALRLSVSVSVVPALSAPLTGFVTTDVTTDVTAAIMAQLPSLASRLRIARIVTSTVPPTDCTPGTVTVRSPAGLEGGLKCYESP
jgi:hypothetical protein